MPATEKCHLEVSFDPDLTVDTINMSILYSSTRVLYNKLYYTGTCSIDKQVYNIIIISIIIIILL